MEKMRVGIDLGTSHVSLVTGDREVWIPNVAGRASDFIARRIFGDDWLVGERALEEEEALEIYRPLRRGLLNLKDKERDTVIQAQRAVIKEGLQRLEVEGEIEAVVGVAGFGLHLAPLAELSGAPLADRIVFGPPPFAPLLFADLALLAALGVVEIRARKKAG